MDLVAFVYCTNFAPLRGKGNHQLCYAISCTDPQVSQSKEIFLQRQQTNKSSCISKEPLAFHSNNSFLCANKTHIKTKLRKALGVVPLLELSEKMNGFMSLSS